MPAHHLDRLHTNDCQYQCLTCQKSYALTPSQWNLVLLKQLRGISRDMSLLPSPFRNENLTLSMQGAMIPLISKTNANAKVYRPRWLRECMAEATGVFFYVSAPYPLSQRVYMPIIVAQQLSRHCFHHKLYT